MKKTIPEGMIFFMAPTGGFACIVCLAWDGKR